VTEIAIEGLSHVYPGGVRALDGVDLHSGAGELMALIGQNGSGKTTLVRHLNGLLRPTEGRVLLDGVQASSRTVAQLARTVGLVFQDPDVQLFCPTVYDDVAFGPLQLGWSEADVRERVERALAQMNVTHLADRAPYELSGGEKKRVAIASVLSMDPDAILLDEPTASLDPRSKSVLVEIIVGLRDMGKTVIVTTHELDIVPTIATRVVVFGDQERRPVASGAAADILADEALLLRTNLIHEHLHWHGDEAHAHPHAHEGEHAHEDVAPLPSA
jgi:cobalt/nickel transport system ATP-binding protein